jgi:hypothetical protein
MSLRCLLMVMFVLAVWTDPVRSAQSKLPIRISDDVIYSLSGLKNSDLMDLDSMTFTLENLGERPLTWIKIRITYKQSRGSPSHQHN